ncbi:carbonic anhydrase 6 [Tachysurus fulvidraco]|uniref:carbonic anhydrase 6 n=1 Tax=Tachysurus fulvidraco TaxID=1234273 RepID=UPI001FEE9512|nr:carbonic anhydrase 6 [Tachysurus fulvidraco]
MELFSVIIHAVSLSFVLAGAGVHWTYKEGSMDQIHWPDEYPACGGRKQSPIDIKRRNVRFNPHMLQLEMTGYGEMKNGKFLMINNGHSVQINLPRTMVITKGLPNQYTAVQMHLHWGGRDLEASGSEHTLDGIRYMAELHVVHYNSDKYTSFDEAKDKPDGLAVLAFFYEDGHFENTYYSDFINNLEKVKYAGQSMYISTLNVRSMLPENFANFFRYEGSLTTPPCYESILWTVFDTPITLSHNQIRKLESTLMDLENKTLWNDYRMAQPLNDRVVESSFLPRMTKGTFCRQDEIEEKLLNIEGMITSLGKHIYSDGAIRPNRKETQIFPLVLYFSANQLESYALIKLAQPMNLHSFTVCMNLRMHLRSVQTVLSYSTPKNDNELMITMGYEVGLWIGNEFVNLPHEMRPNVWAHYCVTWASHTGGAELWVNGVVGEEQYLRAGYTIPPSGDLILGKDQDGFLGISDSDAFVGYMTDVNIWDYVLGPEEIQEEMKCERKSGKSNVLNWGVTRMNLYGGVQLETEHRCS